MLLADNHFTPVLGIDIHFTTVPPFNPFQPYSGFVLAPIDYIPFIGATVHVNGLKRGVSDTQGVIIPLMRVPLPTGALIGLPKDSREQKSTHKINSLKNIIRLWVHPYQ